MQSKYSKRTDQACNTVDINFVCIVAFCVFFGVFQSYQYGDAGYQSGAVYGDLDASVSVQPDATTSYHDNHTSL